ncbi:polysaccharide deacetylase family protein [Actinacidiphila bryophytorum]|uniref:Peptidoglycan/xylan/chitin deacetylase, PgdA/CDA1 family n=1 Tax=Actinacidiphila bryophytorum TaxID=1436133 RepID=A0A9W4H4N3_9ACTN|nr:polysaccharide deacetylase family protein [Actinacidiphila bryophytorum]MBM9435706.1 polysaccharide deacetylase family protein [Actinacidiphila bryophytorum]MBN6547261.1 polysaccharide deacetylase family protein [Actinacidiphila bryophytorum]CAG7650620.1 Peptidoglycan/xylan/chitin deacetylase, PgdA/CDA1 family [Actinacidiphila bryophytorum]
MPSDTTQAPWVLMYHSVADCRDDPYHVTVSPQRLAAQLGWLRRRGLTGVGVAELLAARAAGRGRGLVGLTFDDGYDDFLTTAVPLLLEHGHRATVFALPGRLGGTNAWDADGPRKALLTAQGIRAVCSAGMEVGSHGLLHTDLTSASVDEQRLAAEVQDSRALLTEVTGRAPEGFCYPYGAVDERALDAVRSAGYGYACGVAPGALTGTYALARTYVGDRDSSPRLHAKRLLHAFPAVREALHA